MKEAIILLVGRISDLKRIIEKCCVLAISADANDVIAFAFAFANASMRDLCVSTLSMCVLFFVIDGSHKQKF